MSRKTIEQNARRDFIVETAGKLFADNDIEDVTMEDLARAAGYTRRTLYSYFKSRDEICLLVSIGDMRSRWSRQKEAVAAAESGKEKLLAWAMALHDHILQNPVSLKLNIWLDYRGIDRAKTRDDIFADFESINEELAEGLREIFRLIATEGSMRSDLDIDMTISHFLYSYRAVLNRALSKNYSFASFDAGEYVAGYLDLFTRGIRNSEGDPR